MSQSLYERAARSRAGRPAAPEADRGAGVAFAGDIVGNDFGGIMDDGTNGKYATPKSLDVAFCPSARQPPQPAETVAPASGQQQRPVSKEDVRGQLRALRQQYTALNGSRVPAVPEPLSLSRQAEVLGRWGHSLEQLATSGGAVASNAAPAPAPAEEEVEAAEEPEPQFRLMTPEEIERMRAEMRRSNHRQQEDFARRRHEIAAGNPVVLSLSMRRKLEYALRQDGPEHLQRALPSCSSAEGRPGAGDEAAPELLADRYAQVVSVLVFRHGFSYAQVLSYLKTAVKEQHVSEPQEVYFAVLDNMKKGMRDDPPAGAHFKPEPVLPETCPVLSGCSGAFVLNKTAGARRFEAQTPVGPGRRLRTWFGPEDAGGEPYVVRRKIVMSDLPIWSKQALIKKTVGGNRVTLLQGETGSGKTTQVPAYILELVEAARQADSTALPGRIVVTQPRRIAAITVAKRVAEELGEVVGEGVVGYKVRGISVCGPRCKIMFCTTGVLLRRLNQEGQDRMFSPETVTHLIVDEVHERNCDTDFMLTFLKQVVHLRSHLRVVLMSATMDADCFLRYFSMGEDATKASPPFLQVEGRCFPTHEVFLDTINAHFGRDGAAKGMSPDELRQEKPRGGSAENDGIDYELIAEILKEIDASDDGAWQFLPEEVRRQHVNGSAKTGSVLIFLPGTGEISQLIATIEESGAPAHWWLLQLHGALGAEEQQDAFKTVLPAGKTLKIIACTNVAETSVTVPDVTVVIDSCRERRTGIDKFSNTPSLKEQWCALDSLKQRRGRAGRVQPGVCIRLLARSKLESLEGKTLPEMRRVPLENINLQLCAMGIPDQTQFFAQTPDPPESSAVLMARAVLRDLGALDEAADDGLTPLGRHLANLPIHPRLGKILVLGCLFNVPGPVLSICGAMSGRSPLMTTQDTQKRTAWQTERQKLLKELNCRSDHCAWAVLMQLWMSDGVVRYDLCKRYGLSYERMSAAFFERRHLGDALAQAGFLPKDFFKEEREREKDAEQPGAEPPDWAVVRAVIAGGLYPNIAQVERSTPKYQGPSNPGERNKWMRYSIMQTHLSDGGTTSFPKACHMHPNSLCFGLDHFQCWLLAFYTIQQTTKLYVYDGTEVSPWAMLLLGGNLEAKAAGANTSIELVPASMSGQRDRVHSWVSFTCERADLVVPLIKRARAAIQAVLARKLSDVQFDPSEAPELQACVEVLRTGGLGFEPVPERPPSWPFLEQLREEGADQAGELARERAKEQRLIGP